MNLAVWIVSGVLAAVFLMAGAAKLPVTAQKLATDPKLAWATGKPVALVRFIGLAEVAGALGLILPGAFDIATWLVPVAAVGLAVVMVGAIVTHAQRKEWPNVAVNLVLLAMAVFVAIERFGPQSF
ncbi:DoxX family protein [Flexivirga sp. ID2601S]|uniref:DoxX family protein n=1 Tax=Flexivirga aerilata TaxID=1656889 RepID=A0A849AN01_9MICO|nr:DoxX family protein [Flexivirga aerilata]